jgi:hypothetical protein
MAQAAFNAMNDEDTIRSPDVGLIGAKDCAWRPRDYFVKPSGGGWGGEGQWYMSRKRV